MMESRKVFFLVLYLLLYSSFSTADLNPDLVNKVEKGIDTSVKLLESLDELANWASKGEDFIPQQDPTCRGTSNGACGSSEVCRNGECVDGCSVYSCGVNAQCSTTNNIQSCSCVSPWIPWKKEEPHREGCRYQELQWVDRNSTDPIPENAVTSKTKHHVCRAHGPDGGWHGGWIYLHGVNTCNYGYDCDEKTADSFQVLVDPCGGSGVYWLSGGIYADSVEIGQAVPWPWIKYVVCSTKGKGIPGKLNVSGLMCNYGYEGYSHRDGNFYSLVKKTCLDSEPRGGKHICLHPLLNFF
ncbi:hypothetical protein ANANG_G00185940 [Anguilla anguilla]|uniref:Uncharacterized protein n=1 Tax=Anguilla anguilla TaxID=7936 RepID=A0A0E9X5A6_ANGAN|nr:hypothetical protein ANANG_G00185940 [Anguilla anguilla]